MAQYISTSTWIISTNKKLILTVNCDDRQSHKYIIPPYFQIIKLNHGCSAFSEDINIPATFTFQSSTSITSHDTLITLYNYTYVPQIWESVNNLNLSFHVNIPPKLAAIPKIHTYGTADIFPNVDTKALFRQSWNWENITLIILTILFTVFLLYKLRHKIYIFLSSWVCLRCDSNHSSNATSNHAEDAEDHDNSTNTPCTSDFAVHMTTGSDKTSPESVQMQSKSSTLHAALRSQK